MHSLEQRVLTILACGHGEPLVGQALPNSSHCACPHLCAPHALPTPCWFHMVPTQLCQV